MHGKTILKVNFIFAVKPAVFNCHRALGGYTCLSYEIVKTHLYNIAVDQSHRALYSKPEIRPVNEADVYPDTTENHGIKLL